MIICPDCKNELTPEQASLIACCPICGSENDVIVSKVHAEISYYDDYLGGVHSDICPPEHDFNKINSEYREFLHQCLDEWLNKSNGTGVFYIGNPKGLSDYD